MSLNVVRILRVVYELQAHTDDVVLNDGEYQVMASNTDGVMTVHVFDVRDVAHKFEKKRKYSQYNMSAPGWENQLARWLWDVDTAWGLRGTIPPRIEWTELLG